MLSYLRYESCCLNGCFFRQICIQKNPSEGHIGILDGSHDLILGLHFVRTEGVFFSSFGTEFYLAKKAGIRICNKIEKRPS